MQANPDRSQRRWKLRVPSRVSLVICGLLGTLLPAAYGLVVGIPEPRIHDEFSYLLAADTFAHGRLTNPTPDPPEFFEAEHILVTPTYMSKYPPGQGLILAAGQVLFGHPIWGVWLSCGLFAASLCWMLQAWVSPRWAAVTTLFAVFSFGIASYWAQSYWGGMLAACGGALLFGGVKRTLRSARVGTSLVMGLGVVILADTRPFEGALACVPAGLLLCHWFVSDRRMRPMAKLASAVVPFAAVLAVGGWANAEYNRAVTGDWKSLPYSVHLKQYFHQGVFIFSNPTVPERLPHKRLGRFYASHTFAPVHHPVAVATRLIEYLPARLQGTIGCTLVDMNYKGIAPGTSLIWIGVLLVVGLRSRWGAFCGVTVFVVVLGQSFVEYWFAHYGAPVVPLILAVFAAAVRRMYVSVQGQRRTLLLTPASLAVLASCCLAANYGDVALAGLFPAPRPANSAATDANSGKISSREDVVRRLSCERGLHLVFVRYDPAVSTHVEWVFNDSDLAAARVIFAHDFGDARNRELLARFPSRTAWLCQVGTRDRQLIPYPPPADVAHISQ